MHLRIFQSMWGMERLGPGGSELSLEQKVDRIVSVGFEGAEVEFDDYELARETTRLLAEHDLDWTAECFPETVDDLAETIERVEEFGRARCSHINLQPNVRPGAVLECIPYILGWQRLAEDAGMEVLFETHRDRMTTDLLFTLQLIEAVPTMKLTADLSHYLVAREFRFPVDEENNALVKRILDRSWAFHGRVASREQVQVQTSFPHNKLWLDLFLGWWEEGFRSWRAQAPPDSSLVFTPELGPPDWYAMTGPDGCEMSDRWEEALQLKGLIETVWQRLEAEV
jgi:hypothetical protein